MVFRSTGSRAYRTSATTAVQNPKPSQNASSTTSPMAGAACPTFTTASTGPVRKRSGGRVRPIPRGIAMARTMTAAITVSRRCSTV